MFVSLEDHQETGRQVLEGFIKEYTDYKNYIESASEQEKQTPRYQHRLTIVEGVEKIYPTLTEEMKQIIQHRYWYKDYPSDWPDLADELYMKVSRVKRIRNALLKRFADAIGWV